MGETGREEAGPGGGRMPEGWRGRVEGDPTGRPPPPKLGASSRGGIRGVSPELPAPAQQPEPAWLCSAFPDVAGAGRRSSLRMRGRSGLITKGRLCVLGRPRLAPNAARCSRPQGWPGDQDLCLLTGPWRQPLSGRQSSPRHCRGKAPARCGWLAPQSLPTNPERSEFPAQAVRTFICVRGMSHVQTGWVKVINFWELHLRTSIFLLPRLIQSR